MKRLKRQKRHDNLVTRKDCSWIASATNVLENIVSTDNLEVATYPFRFLFNKDIKRYAAV